MTSSNIHICVLVSTYNHGRYIDQCLRSLLSQTLRPDKIKIYDDCSSDGTWNTLQKYKKEEPNLFELYRNEKNLGARANNTRLWAAVDGEFCAYIEGDDFWAPQKLEGEYNALLRVPDAGAAYSNVGMTDENGKITSTYHNPIDGQMRSGGIFLLVATRQIFPRTRNCFRNYLFRTGCFRSLDWKIDKHIPTMGDYDLHLAFTSRYQFAASNITMPTVFYRRHPTGVSNNYHDVRLAQMLIYEKYDENFKKLSPIDEAACRLFQETMLSTMVADFPEEKQNYYNPGNVYKRMLQRVASLQNEFIDGFWRSNIGLFRQLAVQNVVELLRAGCDQEAFIAWVNHIRNETHPLEGWFSLSPEIFARLQSTHKSYLNSRNRKKFRKQNDGYAHFHERHNL